MHGALRAVQWAWEGASMSATVERIAKALIDCEFKDYQATARDVLEAIREPDPSAVARAADRLGIAPSDVTRLVGTWQIMVEEMMR